jgi:hypothetical protein
MEGESAMKFKRILSLVIIVMLFLGCSDGDSGCTASDSGCTSSDSGCTSNGPSTSIPKDSNKAEIKGKNGTPRDGLPVECASGAVGNVEIPPHSFDDDEEIELEIECFGFDSSEAKALQKDVEKELDPQSDALGAITLEPSPFDFDNYVTIIVPLVEQRLDLAGKFVRLYIYTPKRTPKFEYVDDAEVAADGWTAEASVNHFTTFVVIGPKESPTTPTGIVPNVVGMEVEAAQATLKEAGFEASVVEIETEAVIAPGATPEAERMPRVSRQDPQAGTELPLGSEVKILVPVEIVVIEAPPAVSLVSYLNGEIVPDLAEAWEISEDGLRWTFFLVKDRQMSDGEPYTSYIVLATLDENWERLTGYEGSEVIDDYTIMVMLEKPNPQFLMEISQIEMPRLVD